MIQILIMMIMMITFIIRIRTIIMNKNDNYKEEKRSFDRNLKPSTLCVTMTRYQQNN